MKRALLVLALLASVCGLAMAGQFVATIPVASYANALPTSCSTLQTAGTGSYGTGTHTLTTSSFAVSSPSSILFVLSINFNAGGAVSAVENPPTDTFSTHNTYVSAGGSPYHVYNQNLDSGVFYHLWYAFNPTVGSGTVTYNWSASATGGGVQFALIGCNGTLSTYDTANSQGGSSANPTISMVLSHMPDFVFTSIFTSAATKPTGFTGLTFFTDGVINNQMGYGSTGSASTYTVIPTGGSSGQYVQWSATFH